MGDNLYYYGEVPERLPDDQQQALLEEFKSGNKEAKDKLVNHNIRFVVFVVKRYFYNVPYDKEDLAQIGIRGLEKAIDTFDKDKKIAFGSYASKCIYNEIAHFLRKLRKDQNVDSLDRIINKNDDGKIRLMDIISDHRDLTLDVEQKEINKIIRELVENLPEKERKIIEMNFGFNGTIYKQNEIANHFSVSQAYISRIIKKILNKIRIKLEEYGVIERKVKYPKRKTRIDAKKTIYEYFSNYSEEQVDKVLENLQEKEKTLIKAVFENDYKTRNLDLKDIKIEGRFYYLIDKMKREMGDKSDANRIKSNKVIKIKTIYERFSDYTKEEVNIVLENLPDKDKSVIKLIYGDDLDKEVYSILDSEISKYFYSSILVRIRRNLEKNRKNKKLIDRNIASIENKLDNELTKDDYIKILAQIKTPFFKKMVNNLSYKEAVIIILKFGYIDGKYFSNSSIANFLGIDIEEVIEIAKKVLLLYKESFNIHLDKVITEETKKLKG